MLTHFVPEDMNMLVELTSTDLTTSFRWSWPDTLLLLVRPCEGAM